MSERTFRLLLGATLLVILFFDLTNLLYVYIGVIIVEALLNWRIPPLISKLRYGPGYLEKTAEPPCTCKYDFEAERAFRFVIAGSLILSCYVFPTTLWFFPWFAGFALFMAGITGICPLAISFKKLGCK